MSWLAWMSNPRGRHDVAASQILRSRVERVGVAQFHAWRPLRAGRDERAMIQTLTTVGLAAAATPVALGWSAWLVAATAGAKPRVSSDVIDTDADADIAVIIPAHNEVEALPEAIASLRRERGAEVFSRIIVVADNCTDGTADLARSLGCEVIERHGDPRGKPAALRAALDTLAETGEDIDGFLILDADCEVAPNVAGELAGGLAGGAQVLQCAYELTGDGDGVATLSRWAFSLKNVVRPRGWDRLGVSSQLFGTGMCFSRELLDRVEFSDHLVEDALLSWQLLEDGVRTRFLSNAAVTSPAAPDRESMTIQRQRWEGGQLRLLKALPRRVGRVLRRGDLRGAVAALDWSTLPLTTGLALWAGLGLVTGSAVALGIASPIALAPVVVAAVALGLYLTIGLAAVGGPAAPLRLLAAAPGFVKWKLGVYAGLSGENAALWRRTPRAIKAEEARS